LKLCEVGPRDGLQNEPGVVAPARRAELVERVVAAGLRLVEIGSFVNPAAVPHMADAESVARALPKQDGVEYAGLVLNERGYDRLAAAGLERVHFVVAASDTFGIRNANATVEQGVARAAQVFDRARGAGHRVSVTIAVAFGCPFEGEVDAGKVSDLAAVLCEAGADEVVLADTIGVAVPGQVGRLVARVKEFGRPVGVHLHNTRNLGLANVYASLEEGVDTIDASLGGTGGCPFAPNATGNVATEDVIYMLDREGIDTGVDMDALISAARWLEGVLGRSHSGGVTRAGGFPQRSTVAA
jgi:isopropylmalate/homocitrate/citramalate synthase